MSSVRGHRCAVAVVIPLWKRLRVRNAILDQESHLIKAYI